MEYADKSGMVKPYIWETDGLSDVPPQDAVPPTVLSTKTVTANNDVNEIQNPTTTIDQQPNQKQHRNHVHRVSIRSRHYYGTCVCVRYKFINSCHWCKGCLNAAAYSEAYLIACARRTIATQAISCTAEVLWRRSSSHKCIRVS
jgi:hypothetical protein